MYKIAFFVEGKTEMLLIERMIEQFARPNPVYIKMMEARGGGKDGRVPLSYKAIGITKQQNNEQFYVLICDCGGEDNVKPRIDEEHKNLHEQGYELIIGIRDVRPKFGIATLPSLKVIMNTAIDKNLIPVRFILPLAEVEAWFLSEHTHFPRIHPSITAQTISQTLGFNPAADDMTIRSNPADDLDDCYRIGNRAYNKSKAKRTINALDMNEVRANLPNRIPELKKLVKTVENFFNPPPTVPPQVALQPVASNAQPAAEV
ncbi:hypothetical protein C9I56_23350 [Paraburkholderia caribensis]|nr:hypothetical protein C9I56_23350 [Paraburkholderia caribensis]